MEDFVTWVDSSAIKKHIMEYNEINLRTNIKELKMTDQSLSSCTLKSLIQDLLVSFKILKTSGIYHRDIKPSNLLLTNQFKLKIIDFSISKQYQDVLSENENQKISVQGTQTYMSPELLKGLQNNEKFIEANLEKSEVYSLGLTILNLVTLDESSTNAIRSFTNKKDIRGYLNGEIKDQLLINLLTNMLSYHPFERYTFNECYNLINENDSTIIS